MLYWSIIIADLWIWLVLLFESLFVLTAIIALPSTPTSTTSRYMTKYERARVLGTRAVQIRYVPSFPLSSLPCPLLPSLLSATTSRSLSASFFLSLDRSHLPLFLYTCFLLRPPTAISHPRFASLTNIKLSSRSMNAPIMVELEGETDPLQIAMKELREKKIPLVIRRYLPDQSYPDSIASPPSSPPSSPTSSAILLALPSFPSIFLSSLSSQWVM